MGNSKPSLDRLFATALAALVLGLSAVIVVMPRDALGNHIGCTGFTINAPKEGISKHTNGNGFTVTIEIQRAIDVRFSGATPPGVVHLAVFDANSRAPKDYPYRGPVTQDTTFSRSPSGSAITRVAFCFVPPPATPTPSPTASPAPSPTLSPTPTLPATPPPTCGTRTTPRARRLHATA